jgi:primosomal protein N' (replication factor Y)
VPDDPLLADVALDIPGQGCFTYLVPDGLAVAAGDCVLVPLGPRRVRGFVVTVARRPLPAFPLKPILEVRQGVRVPPHLLRLITWGAGYYRCSVGEFLAGAVPAPVRQGVQQEVERRLRRVAGWTGELPKRQRDLLAALPDHPLTWSEACAAGATTRPTLAKLVAAGALAEEVDDAIREVTVAVRAERHAPTAEQQTAIDAVAAALDAGTHQTFLLYGVTGSGKTLVYLELAERVIAAGRQVLFLLPEIALTPQLAARVRSRIPRTAVWHSGFTDGERARLWQDVAAGRYDCVLGTRSALFAPLPAPGLILVDEEHEHTYKQESVPRYHARDLAVVYASQLGVPAILGSATPSCESVANARPDAAGRAPRYRVLVLKHRPRGGSLPQPLVVDMRRECEETRKPPGLSRLLVQRLGDAVAQRQQAIVLLNRRGWSPVVTCQGCGATVECGSCSVSLTWHKGANILKCHYCGHQRPLPTACPVCNGKLAAYGLGTEQLAELVRQAVPQARVLRADADTVSGRQGHAQLVATFAAGEADVLVGTQMIAKGLDFPKVTVVGVIGADKALAAPDFRAAERTYQLIAQVAGRAGRGELPGTVIVQAWDPEALPIRAAIENRAKGFYDSELALRAEYAYPPYAGLVRILWSGPSAAAVQGAAEADARLLEAAAQGAVVLGPTPAAMSLLKGQHRWHALIKAASRAAAQGFLDRLRQLPRRSGVQVAIDVDPVMTS